MQVLRLPSSLALTLILVTVAGAQNDTLRVNTRLVQVNVVVRDKDGAVGGLKASDFTIFDNKKEQKIELFSLSEARSMPKPAVPQGATLVSNLLDTEGEVPAGATVILFDMLNTSDEDQRDAVKQLVSYLKTIRKEDRVALYILSQQLYVVKDFTGDPNQLVQAAERIRASELAGVEIRNPSQLAVMLQPPNFTIGSSAPIWVSLPMSYFMSDASTVNRAVATADALQAIGRHLKGLPGRKNLVWLSAGFPFSPPTRARRPGDARGGAAPETPDNFSSEISRAARFLNDANVALYPVDVRGLAGGYPEVMLRLADATGGTAAYYTNDLEGAVRAAVVDGEIGYTLGFYSSADPNDKTFHELKVKVNHRGAVVRHRAGYYPDDSRMLSERERQAVIGELLGSPLNSSELGLTGTASPDPTISGNFRVTVTVNTRDIRFDARNNRHTAKLTLATRLESSKDKTIKTTSIPIGIPDDAFATAIAQGIPLTSTLLATRGDRLKVVVQDQATGLTGALWLPLN